MCGRIEGSLAVAAYGGKLEDDGCVLKMPGLVSRKKDFVPALTKAVREGWTPPEEVVSDHEQRDLKRSRSMADVAQGDVVVDYSEEPSGKLVRRDSVNYAAADGAKAGQGA